MPDILAPLGVATILENLLVIGAVIVMVVGAALLLRFMAPTTSTMLPSKEAHETFTRIENGEEP